MRYVLNFFGHLHTINKHRLKVFILCCKAGIPVQGLLHDLSKYSPTEFFEGVKYYAKGKYSPILNAKKNQGYSKAWLHHKGRNKHHHEYWFDYAAPLKAPVIPYKYAVEMICDMIAASKNYQGKKYTDMAAYYYWNKVRDNCMVNRKIQGFMTEVFETLGANGEKYTINPKYLRSVYDKYTKKKEKEDKNEENSEKNRN